MKSNIPKLTAIEDRPKNFFINNQKFKVMANQNKRFLVTYAEQDVSKEAAVKLLGVTQTSVKEGVRAMSSEKAPSSKDVLHFEKMGVSVLELSSAEAKEISTKKGVLVVEEDIEMFALDCNLGTAPLGYEPEVYINQEEMAKLEGKAKNQRASKNNVGVSRDVFIEAVEAFNPAERLSIVGDKVVPEAESQPFIHQIQRREKASRQEDGFMAENRLMQSAAGGYADGYKKAMLDVFSSMLDANLSKSSPEQSGTSSASADAMDVGALVNASYIPWNIRMVKAPEAWNRGYDGRGIKVAVLDTGIDYNHQDLYVYGGANFSSSSGNYMDRHGHGTHCAGVIAAREYYNQMVGVAPRARLYAVKVLGDNGSGSSSSVISGMEWCVQNGIQVASMSLGSSSNPSYAYIQAVSRCQQNGVLVVAAAGNAGHTSGFPWVGSPANSAREGWWSTSPIAVGAVDSNNQIAYFSSRGTRYSTWNPVGCVAPGVNIRSTVPGNNYDYMSGTSMATPHVAGLAALLFQRWGTSTWTYWIKKQLLLGTYYSHPYQPSVAKGFGLIDCDRVVSLYYLNTFWDNMRNWYMFQ